MASSRSPSIAHRAPAVATVALAVALALALAPVAAGAGPVQLLAAVQNGDGAIGHALTTLNAPLQFIDGDRDLKASPGEPAYWDLDDSTTVSVGDLRLRPYLAYGAGSLVQVTDHDTDRALYPSSGWFGSANGAWFADFDATKTVTAGDVRMASGAAVGSGDGDLGAALSFPQVAMPPGRIGLDDRDGDRRRDAGEDVYVDLDAGNVIGPALVGVGDLRQLAATTASSGSSASGGATAGAGGDGSEGDGSTPPPEAPSSGEWTAPVVLAVLLGLANLAGLVFVYSRLRGGGPPRNPFK